MTGQGHWMTFVILLVAVSPVLVMWISEKVSARRYRNEQSPVRCRPHDNKLVQVTVVRDAKTDEPIGVKACSEFADPEKVSCERACLPQFKHHTA